jgi:hypothetical protein
MDRMGRRVGAFVFTAALSLMGVSPQASGQSTPSWTVSDLIASFESLCIKGDAGSAYATRTADQAGWVPVTVTGPLNSDNIRQWLTPQGKLTLMSSSGTDGGDIHINKCIVSLVPSTPDAQSLYQATSRWLGVPATDEVQEPPHQYFMFTVGPNGARTSGAGLSKDQIHDAERAGKIRVVIADWFPNMAALQYLATVPAPTASGAR